MLPFKSVTRLTVVSKAALTWSKCCYCTVSDMSPTAAFLVPVDKAKEFVQRSMIAVGTKVDHAKALAEVLILADQRGHYSHGLNRLG